MSGAFRTESATCRAFGLKCLSYIDDGLGGTQPMAEAVRMSGMVRTLFTEAGFALNIAKSHFDPAPEHVITFIE